MNTTINPYDIALYPLDIRSIIPNLDKITAAANTTTVNTAF